MKRKSSFGLADPNGLLTCDREENVVHNVTYVWKGPQKVLINIRIWNKIYIEYEDVSRLCVIHCDIPKGVRRVISLRRDKIMNNATQIGISLSF